jgi:hypothetical protein
MIKREVPHVKFEITPTISLWNVHQFPAFHKDWIDKGLLSKAEQMRLNILTGPWFASILILPKAYKEELLPMYRAVMNDESYSINIRNAYRTVLNTLKSGEENKGGIQEFFDFNYKLDEHRKESLFQVIPELEKVYEWSRN